MARTVRLTQEGYERLQETLQREYKRLEEATKILSELTRSSDDYDDSGLEDAKQEKSRIEQRIDTLEDQLERAEIIEASEHDAVDLGAIVTLKDDSNNESFDIQLVSPVEAGVLDSDIPKVSDESPLGKAVMGMKSGQNFSVTINNKTKAYTVVSIN